MKQSKGFNGGLKPERKKTTNKTTMSPTTDNDSYPPTIWNRLTLEEGTVIQSEDRPTVVQLG